VLLLLVLILWNVGSSVFAVCDAPTDVFGLTRKVLNHFDGCRDREEMDETDVFVCTLSNELSHQPPELTGH
jgi:hypothetical protein